MKFISLDPSLRNFGIVWGTIKNNQLHPEGWHLCRTSKSKNKTVLVSSDTVNNCREIYDTLNKVIIDVNPQVVFAELPSGSKSSAAMKSYGVSCFALATVNPPPLLFTPIAVKKGIIGKNSASKAEMMHYAYTKFPNFPWEMNGSNLKVTTMEHIADAICVAEHGITTAQFKQLQSMIQ